MYINPILAGVAVTLLTEMAIVIAAVLWITVKGGRR